MFPAKAVEVHGLFYYKVCKKGYKNVSLILHDMVPMPFYNFKTPVYQWLQLNKMYATKTIFKSSKDDVVCIVHLTNINPQHIDRTQYQDQINKLLDEIADEKHNKDPTFHEMHHTTSEYAKYHVHLCTDTAFVKIARQKYETEAIGVKFVLASLKYDPMIKNNVDHYKTLIRGQNAHLTNYADFRIGGISEAMLNVEVNGKT
eukprot:9142696-Ditylum_brightwellii.AAC.1